MYYVEYLRATRALRVGVIVIAICLALNLTIFLGGGVLVPDKPFVIPLMVVWAVAGVTASIFATLIGCSLAKENDGHLPVAWTKPVSRTSHAAVKMIVDIAAIAAFFAIVGIVTYAYLSMTGMVKYVAVQSDTWVQLLRFALAPLAFYGLVQFLTASVGRRAGTIIGLMWVALFVLSALGSSPFSEPYHSIFAFINHANPLVYIAVQIDKGGSVITASLGAATLGLVLIAALGIAGAIYQWQRLEA